MGGWGVGCVTGRMGVHRLQHGGQGCAEQQGKRKWARSKASMSNSLAAPQPVRELVDEEQGQHEQLTCCVQVCAPARVDEEQGQHEQTTCCVHFGEALQCACCAGAIV